MLFLLSSMGMCSQRGGAAPKGRRGVGRYRQAHSGETLRWAPRGTRGVGRCRARIGEAHVDEHQTRKEDAFGFYGIST